MTGWLMTGWVIDWLASCLTDWLMYWFNDYLIDWVIDWLADWLIGWLIAGGEMGPGNASAQSGQESKVKTLGFVPFIYTNQMHHCLHQLQLHWSRKNEEVSQNARCIFSSNMWYQLAGRLSVFFLWVLRFALSLRVPQVPSNINLIPNFVIAELALRTTWL